MITKIINGREVLVWNTNRHYTPDGQRMVAVLNIGAFESGVVFMDYDRHIEGVLPVCQFHPINIMEGYDTCSYHPVGNTDDYMCVLFLHENKEEILKLLEKKENGK